MSKSHEDIRFIIISKLRASILQAINRIREAKLTNVLLQLQLDGFEEIIEKGEDVPLIIKNERILKEAGRPDIEVFAGKLLFEIKVKKSEFADGLVQLYKYIPFYPYSEFAIITNNDAWEFYKIENEKLTQITSMDLDSIVEEILIKGFKFPLSTENMKNLFNPIILSEQELFHIFDKYHIRKEALFRAYRNIIRRLYEKASDADIEKLYIKHTLIQMIVSSCLTASSKIKTSSLRACSGIDIGAEIILPYLKWWESLLIKRSDIPEINFLNNLLDSIYSKVRFLDWDGGGKDDIFRELYEILIDPETRRKIGEYYTPLWLVEYMINQTADGIDGFKEKVILDPFCGSGTFLVAAFYKKIDEGEKAEDAIKEIIGFDINPLAVSIARAELMIAYQSQKPGEIITPLVFNTDSASLLLRNPSKWEPTSFLEELTEVEKMIEYIDSSIFVSTELDFSEILVIEMILRRCFREADQADNIKEVLQKGLGKLKEEKWKGLLTQHITKTLADDKSIEALSNLIEKYGDGVWAVSITSLFAPYIIRKVNVDIIVTNPPWLQLTEPKGTYGELLRKKAAELLEGYSKSGQILVGSDISSVLLYGCINVAKIKVGILIPDETVYTTGSYYGLGKVLTYSVIRNTTGSIVQVGFDAFQHGRLSSMIFIEKEEGPIQCNTMFVEWTGNYSKALHLSDVNISIKKGESYDDYIKNVISYTETSSDDLEEALGVEKAMSMGDYVRGLFGGTKKKKAKSYAGLIFDIISEDTLSGQIRMKLSNTQETIKIPKYYLVPYWKKLIYTSDIFPFYFHGIKNVLLSNKGEKDLKEFLQEKISSNAVDVDKEKIEVLTKECKQPEVLKPLEKDKYYVIYRRIRTFVSFVLTPKDFKKYSNNYEHEIIVYDACSYVMTSSEDQANYYSSILNYLIYKVIEQNGKFERNQYLRPLIALKNAGLEWKNKKWQIEISELGKQLQNNTETCFRNFIKKGIQVKKCIEQLKACPDTSVNFKKIIELADKNVDMKKLVDALAYVCKLDTQNKVNGPTTIPKAKAAKKKRKLPQEKN